jgi:predicted membrane-bound spermidine synthase
LSADIDTEFLDQGAMAAMFHFPRDLHRHDVEPNRLTTAVLSEYYRDGWKAFH